MEMVETSKRETAFRSWLNNKEIRNEFGGLGKLRRPSLLSA